MQRWVGEAIYLNNLSKRRDMKTTYKPICPGKSDTLVSFVELGLQLVSVGVGVAAVLLPIQLIETVLLTSSIHRTSNIIRDDYTMYIYIYIYICVCVCVCAYVIDEDKMKNHVNYLKQKCLQ